MARALDGATHPDGRVDFRNRLGRLRTLLVDEAAAVTTRERVSWRRLAAMSLLLFGLSLGARVLYLQDQRHQIEFAHEHIYTQPAHYQRGALRILHEGLDAFLASPYTRQGSGRYLDHPPGYSIAIAAVFAVAGESSNAQRACQLVLDALSVVLLFLIAVEILSPAVATVAATLAALSPQFAFNALVLQPDTAAVFPILCAAFALVHAWRRQSLLLAAVAGLSVGLSCWMRSNAFLLPLFLAVVVPFLFARGRRLRAALLLASAAYLVVAPITIRNWIVFHRFIPTSLGSGVTFAEGIGDFDPERHFGLPPLDDEIARAEAIWYGRPDYARNLWAPDGIDRDRARFARALGVVKAHPFWFATVMARRAALMVRYNDRHSYGWPADTSLSPVLPPGTAIGIVQKLVYRTEPMRLLILAGVALLLLARRRAELLLLGAVPLYYALFQSALHTEYRYILAMHHFLFVLAAIALCAAAKIATDPIRAIRVIRGLSSPAPQPN